MSAPPRWATERTDRDSYGPKVGEVAEALGFELMPWQRLVLDTALEHEDGRLVYRDVAGSVPRQAAKTTTALLMLTWRMLAAPCNAVYGAQSRLAARVKLLDDWYPVLCRSSLTKAFDATRGTGSESLRAPRGRSVVRVISTDEAAGHGQTLSLGILDEAWSLGPEAEQAVRPAMSTKRNGQLWVCSTAGTSRSTWWREKVELGREAVESGRRDGLAYFEWSAEPDADLDDPGVLAAFHPAVGHTVEADTIRADIAAMSPTQARRAYGNVWTDDADGGWSAIAEEQWKGAAW
jgi:phage terminase large subunit-like protein